MATDATKDEAPEEIGRREFSEAELTVARRVYDQMRTFVAVPASMMNQIYRNGILTKKTIDGSGSTRMVGSRNYWRE